MFEQKNDNKKEETFDSMSKKLEAQGFHFYGTANTHESRYNKDTKSFLVDQEVRTTDEIIESYKIKPEFSGLEKDKIEVELVKKEGSIGSYFIFVKILE